MSGSTDPLGLDPLGPIEVDELEAFPVRLEIEPLSPPSPPRPPEGSDDDD